MNSPYLYMIILGCLPEGRLTEQHDVFFGIAASLKELIPAMKHSWPEAKGEIHIDAWRRVTQVGGYGVEVQRRTPQSETGDKLFFINLGGYKAGEFEEYHYKLLAIAPDKGKAIQQSKQTAFYKHTGFKGAVSHVDDKYGVDVDDAYEITEILAPGFKNDYQLIISKCEAAEDTLNIGYFNLDKLSDAY